MAHPLVTQLRFTRREWIRGLRTVTALSRPPRDAQLAKNSSMRRFTSGAFS
jgi:hypothetical protein